MKSGVEMNKEELKAALKNARDNLSGGTYRNLEVYEASVIHDYEMKAAKLNKKANGGITTTFLWFFIGYSVVFLPAYFYYASNKYEADLLGMVILAIMFGIALPFIVRKRANQKSELLISDTKRILGRIEEQKKGHIADHPEIYGFMPSQYVTIAAVEKLMGYIDEGRAGNLKEAINILEGEERLRGLRFDHSMVVSGLKFPMNA